MKKTNNLQTKACLLNGVSINSMLTEPFIFIIELLISPFFQLLIASYNYIQYMINWIIFNAAFQLKNLPLKYLNHATHVFNRLFLIFFTSPPSKCLLFFKYLASPALWSAHVTVYAQ